MEKENEKSIIIDLTDENFNYSIPSHQPNIDWDCLNYNYNTFECFANKLPRGFESIIGFDKIIEMMVMNSKTPLQEMELRIKSQHMYNNDGDNTNFSELKDSG